MAADRLPSSHNVHMSGLPLLCESTGPEVHGKPNSIQVTRNYDALQHFSDMFQQLVVL